MFNGYWSGTGRAQRVLREHPSVAEVAVVGVPDEQWGAFVVPLVPVDTVELRAYCRERLAACKVPARVVVVDDLPMTGLGKVRRTELA